MVEHTAWEAEHSHQVTNWMVNSFVDYYLSNSLEAQRALSRVDVDFS